MILLNDKKICRTFKQDYSSEQSKNMLLRYALIFQGFLAGEIWFWQNIG